jgi:dUTP pyrophosphatase
MIKVKIVNKSKHELPKQATKGDAGFDIRANIEKEIALMPNPTISPTDFANPNFEYDFRTTIIPTGIYMEIPEGYEAQVRPRSGLAAKHGITVLNSPGTIDCGYRGEVKVILTNLSGEEFIIEDGMRIAQIVIQKLPSVEFEEVTELSDTERGKEGFGHSGIK